MVEKKKLRFRGEITQDSIRIDILDVCWELLQIYMIILDHRLGQKIQKIIVKRLGLGLGLGLGPGIGDWGWGLGMGMGIKMGMGIGNGKMEMGNREYPYTQSQEMTV